MIDYAHRTSRDHDPPFLTRLQLNPNSGNNIRQIGRKKQHFKSLDPYLSVLVSD